MGSTSENHASQLFRFNADRNDIIDEVVDRVTRDFIDRAWRSPSDGLSYLLNEAAYVELARLEKVHTPEALVERARWQSIARSMGRATEEENAERLRRMVRDFAGETVGHFRPNVFRFATKVVPAGLSYVLSRGLRPDAGNLGALRDRLIIDGEVGKLRRLSELGTIVYVPTHSSHLDSILVSWAMHEANLPAVVYGADSNLFSHPIMSFFMGNLGAYKVDRERSFRLHRRVVKTYSQVLLEYGYHSMFFPAGQRSRSNQFPSALKLGLLSTALEAYTENVIHDRPKAPVFIVPVTINYHTVLEAPTLIDDYLREDGLRQAIIKDDEFSRVGSITRYVRASLDNDLTVTVRFCTPMDVFGNRVDHDGESIDQQGRRVDPVRYLWVNGEVAPDEERDRAYTRLLASRVLRAFSRNNVIQPIHIVSFALIEHMLRAHPTWGLKKTLRFAKGDGLASAVAVGETERLLRIAKRDASESKYRLSRATKTQTASQMLDDVIRIFESFGGDAAITRDGKRVRLQNPELLLFYSNRLRDYDLERRLGATPGGY